MHTNRSIAALASAALLIGLVPAGAASAQTAPATPAMQTTSPMTTPTKSPVDMKTPAAMPGNGTAPAGVLGVLALDARNLIAQRTHSGYIVTGQALVKDACQAARFDPSLLTIYPPQFNLDQFRRPGTMGMMCIQGLKWVVAQSRMVTSMKPPAYITVRTKKGVTRVPIR